MHNFTVICAAMILLFWLQSKETTGSLGNQECEYVIQNKSENFETQSWECNQLSAVYWFWAYFFIIHLSHATLKAVLIEWSKVYYLSVTHGTENYTYGKQIITVNIINNKTISSESA